MDRAHLLAVARGDQPADLLFTNARVVNVFTGEVEEVDVAVAEGLVAGLGTGYHGSDTVDAGGAFLVPGLIDAHVHIESSMVAPPEFARAVLPRGTTTVVTDPHEIANVHGLDGIRWMLAASEGLPLSVFVMASSCVPATPLATAGADLDAAALAGLDHPRVLGLAELMNFPGAIGGDPAVMAKLEAFAGRPIDGHAPGVTGQELNAYVAAGPGSDHECTTAQEATEKLRRGLRVFLRQATNARNLRALLPALTPANRRRAAFCTDDRHPGDLLDEGGIDAMVRMAVAEGLAPVEAVRLATLNPAEFFGLADRGAIAPGRRADLVLAPDLDDFRAAAVYSAGRLVARDGEMTADVPAPPPPPSPSMRVDWGSLGLEIPARAGRTRVIRMVPDQLITGSEAVAPTVVDGRVVADPGRDLLKIAVIERHTGSGRVGLGLVSGMGLREGAMAGTVAHDHHNIIVIGATDEDMLMAAREVAEAGGGLAVARDGMLMAALPLPVGGLMSLEPVEAVRDGLDAVIAAVRSLGSPLHDPFMAMSFLGLEVIPSLKITDRGLVDVDAFAAVELWA